MRIIVIALLVVSIIAPTIILTDNNPPWPSAAAQIGTAVASFFFPLLMAIVLSAIEISGRCSEREREAFGEVWDE